MASARPRLRALAARLGIEHGYVSALDQSFVATRDTTREALVASMGWDGSTEEAAADALTRLGEPAAPPPPAAQVPCLGFRERLGDARVFGLWTNLYSIRSQHNLGFGSLRDLRELVEQAGREGAAFVGLNPLHAVANRDSAVCPYAPVSRLFRNPLYLDLERVPGLAEVPEARARLGALSARVEELRAAERLDARAVEEVLFAVLRPLHARLLEGRAETRRPGDYAAYRRAQGEALTAFATYQALADDQEAAIGARDWRRWPSELRDPRAPAVRAFRERNEARVEFHAWLQFELDAQLGELAEDARHAGLALGLYTDLALGSEAGGFDTWAHPQLFARGVSVGAPPDAFSLAGQDWGFPPLDPHALRRDGFAFWRRVLEANLRGAGALRIDHALGLRRLFWIPEGAAPGEGAYVRFPEAELLAVLGGVSRRLGALVIGEDLGTIPEGFSEQIQARGMLSSRVLLFERGPEGFHPSAAWPEACLATANTHDLPPLAGWLGEDDLELRRGAGQIPDDTARDAMRAERRADRAALRNRLVAEGCLAADVGEGDSEAWTAAVTRFLCRTPAVLVGLSLDDLAGERIPINLPGVSSVRHPSWVRRMGPTLDGLFADPRVRRVLDAIPAGRRALR